MIPLREIAHARSGDKGNSANEVPNLEALNFVLPDILAGGGSRSLRIDAQGKTLGMALLEMPVAASEVGRVIPNAPLVSARPKPAR